MQSFVLAGLPKLKKGLGLIFGAHFLHTFSIYVSYLILYLWTRLQCHTLFSSQNIKQNVIHSDSDN